MISRKERIFYRSLDAAREYVESLRETNWNIRTKPKMVYRDMQEEKGQLNWKVFKKSCFGRLYDYREDAYRRGDVNTINSISTIMKLLGEVK